MIDWAAVEADMIAAATAALERGTEKVLVRAKQLAPYRRQTEAQEAQVKVRFKTNADPRGKGWSLVCETPGPLTEVTVPFTLKNIAIP